MILNKTNPQVKITCSSTITSTIDMTHEPEYQGCATSSHKNGLED